MSYQVKLAQVSGSDCSTVCELTVINKCWCVTACGQHPALRQMSCSPRSLLAMGTSIPTPSRVLKCTHSEEPFQLLPARKQGDVEASQGGGTEAVQGLFLLWHNWLNNSTLTSPCDHVRAARFTGSFDFLQGGVECGRSKPEWRVRTRGLIRYAMYKTEDARDRDAQKHERRCFRTNHTTRNHCP